MQILWSCMSCVLSCTLLPGRINISFSIPVYLLIIYSLNFCQGYSIAILAVLTVTKIPVLAQSDHPKMPRAAVQTCTPPSELQGCSGKLGMWTAATSDSCSRKQVEGFSGVQHMSTEVKGVLAILGRWSPIKLWLMSFKVGSNNSVILRRTNVKFAQLNQRQGQSSFWVSPKLSPQKPWVLSHSSTSTLALCYLPSLSGFSFQFCLWLYHKDQFYAIIKLLILPSLLLLSVRPCHSFLNHFNWGHDSNPASKIQLLSLFAYLSYLKQPTGVEHQVLFSKTF